MAWHGRDIRASFPRAAAYSGIPFSVLSPSSTRSISDFQHIGLRTGRGRPQFSNIINIRVGHGADWELWTVRTFRVFLLLLSFTWGFRPSDLYSVFFSLFRFSQFPYSSLIPTRQTRPHSPPSKKRITQYTARAGQGIQEYLGTRGHTISTSFILTLR